MTQPQIDVTNLSDRTKWYQVNPNPYSISPQVNQLCADPTQLRPENDPHANKAITVFVNPIGRDAMMSPKSTPFPIGSIIVKKKVDPRSLEDVALLYTVMIKHQPSFNPKAGGWEFAVVSGDTQKTQVRGTLTNCMGCHLSQRQNDYVFRTYLPK
ncbi:cytochrome P460 family protein [Tumidithrix elongata]|uniref:cytochrome P460 family protein n=1 Tax=Tumidithrix elongata TaxID=3088357 RepID=UPI002ED2EB09